jgi:hypothetical protein
MLTYSVHNTFTVSPTNQAWYGHLFHSFVSSDLTFRHSSMKGHFSGFVTPPSSVVMLANIGFFLKFLPCKISVSLTENNMKSLRSEFSELIASDSHYSVIQSERN